MPPKRMTANPIAPLRYRPGKAVGNEEPSSSESDSGSESEVEEVTKKPTAAPKATSFPKINTSNFDLNARQAAAVAGQRAKEAKARAAEEEGFVTASESSGDEQAGSVGESKDDEEEDDSEDESSEEDTRAARFVAPTFISKAQRQATNTSSTSKPAAEVTAERDEQRRKEKADELLQAQLEKDAAERIAARRAWDDDDEAIADEVNDTDDLDPEAERAAWKLRELKRIKRDREAIEVAEQEREEVERRRNLSKEEREAEDAEHIAAQNAEKDAKGKMGYMQKYFHKGAFFQGEGGEVEEEAKRRDIMGARFADDAAGMREVLPQYMQIRDMTKLGKKGRTKYRDLKSEDTGRWGDFGDDRRGGGVGGGGRGGFGDDRQGPSGANAYAVGERRPRDDERGGERDEKRPRYDR